MFVMHRSVNVTAAIFTAYLKCPTKGYLIAHGEDPPDAFIAVTRGCMSAAYKARAGQSPQAGLPGVAPIHFSRLADDTAHEATTLFVDCETTSYVCNPPASAQLDGGVKRPKRGRGHVPILLLRLGQNRSARRSPGLLRRHGNR